jgi:hypothetical protein
MTDQHKRPQDANQLAKSIIDRVTGHQPSPVSARGVAAAPDHEYGLEKELAPSTTKVTPERRAAIKKNPNA